MFRNFYDFIGIYRDLHVNGGDLIRFCICLSESDKKQDYTQSKCSRPQNVYNVIL